MLVPLIYVYVAVLAVVVIGVVGFAVAVSGQRPELTSGEIGTLEAALHVGLLELEDAKGSGEVDEGVPGDVAGAARGVACGVAACEVAAEVAAPLLPALTFSPGRRMSCLSLATAVCCWVSLSS